MTPDEIAAHPDREATYFQALATKYRELAWAKTAEAVGSATDKGRPAGIEQH